MARKSDWYAGSVREAKRTAYLAGVEAGLDTLMKVCDGAIKTIRKDPEMGDALKSELALIVMTISKDAYKGSTRLMASTPFEDPGPVTQREPGTADRE